MALISGSFLFGCGPGESKRDVTDIPKYVGSYRRGQTYVARTDLGDQIVIGDKVEIQNAYLISGLNFSYVEIYARSTGKKLDHDIPLRSFSVRNGNQNLDGDFLSGPDPKYLELAK